MFIFQGVTQGLVDTTWLLGVHWVPVAKAFEQLGEKELLDEEWKINLMEKLNMLAVSI